MNVRKWYAFGLVLIMVACNKDAVVPVPTFGITSLIDKSKPIPNKSKPLMEGIYLVTSKSSQFGDTMVVKWNRCGILMACKNGKHFIMEAGELDSAIIMQGYWRDGYSDATGLCTFTIANSEGAGEILAGRGSAVILLRGVYGNSEDVPTQSIVLSYLRPFSTKVKENPIYILGHRAGGRNSDRLPVSENSIAMVRFTERLGTTGIEIDARISSDGVAFIYHDDDINTRLTRKGLLAGDVSAYTWLQLESFVTLIHGEQIPSLDEVLTFTIDSTELQFIYIDLKSAAAVPYVIPVQQRAIQRAKDKGRDIKILTGIPDDEVLTAIKGYPNYEDVPSICELSVEDVRSVNAEVWAPRWTLGTQNDMVQQIHEEGRLAVCWTIDSPIWIHHFVDLGSFDGLLTNFPYVVVYHFYMKD